MPVEFLNPLTDPSYDEFIHSHPNATIFHTSSWLRVLHETYGYKTGCVALIERNAIHGLLPFMETFSITGKRRCVSLPFSDFCEPLFVTESDFKKVFYAFTEKAKVAKWQYIEFRGGMRLFQNEQFSDEILTHDIDLTQNGDIIFRSFRDSTRRNIKKARSNGVQITHQTSIEATRTFYHLNCITRKEHGIPPQPWFFFKYLWQRALKNGQGFITIASYKNKPIAADLFLIFNNIGFYKYGAMDRKSNSFRPSNLTLWEGMLKCKELGCNRINLGRSELHHKGLLQFKRGFRCREELIRYFHYDFSKQKFLRKKTNYRLLSFRTQLFSKMPMYLLQMLSRYFYRYAG